MEIDDPKAQLKADRIRTIAIIFKMLCVVVVLVGLLVYDIVREKPAPIDNSINKKASIVDKVRVRDSIGNGFLVSYATTNNVTTKRLDEIRSRPHIKKAFYLLKTEAPLHFGNMLETDIYDFADFALQDRYHVDPDIYINTIFIQGREKLKLYTQPNPEISNPATYISHSDLQGAQYITKKDIYFADRKNGRIYRYYKCRGHFSTSSTDERYIHFSEDEREE